MVYKSGITTIQLTPATREKLKAMGKKGETYDGILLRLMSQCKK